MRQLIVLVDALGWLTVTRLDFLRDLLPWRRPLRTVFGYSSTAIPSLLTGASPRDHGHWFLYRRARGGSPFREAGWIARLPGRPDRRWRIRSKLKTYWMKKNKIQGYFSLYDIPFGVLRHLDPVERMDTWAAGAFPATPSLIDFLAARKETFHVSDWRVPDADKLARAREVWRAERPAAMVLYLTGVDGVQHRVGTRHRELDEVVAATGRAVRELRDVMAAEGPVAVTLFSDHGMTDVTRVEALLGPLEEQGLRRGRDFDGFIDSTVARFWDVRRPEALRRALGALPWGRVLDDATLRAWGVDFPDREYGDHFFLADPGVLIVPSDMGSAPLAAMHGYDPADPTSDACLLSDRDLDPVGGDILAVLPALRRRIEEGR